MNPKLHVVHGQTRHAQAQRAHLEAAINRANVHGTLYFGYPVLTTAESRQPLDALLGVLHSMDVVLEHDLLGGVGEMQSRQPAPVGHGPARLAGIDAPMPEQEALQMLACLRQRPYRGSRSSKKLRPLGGRDPQFCAGRCGAPERR